MSCRAFRGRLPARAGGDSGRWLSATGNRDGQHKHYYKDYGRLHLSGAVPSSGEDKTEYRLLTKDYVKVVECDGRKILKVDPAGLELLSKAAYSDVSFYLRAAHLQSCATSSTMRRPPTTTSSWPTRCCSTSAWPPRASCRPARTPARPSASGTRARTSGREPTTPSASPGSLRDLQGAQPPLFAGRALHDDRREELGHEPSGADRHLRRQARHGVRVPLHHQGRRLGQQDLPLPADQGAAERGVAHEIHPTAYLRPRHVGLPAVPPGPLHRRHVGRDVPLDGEEGFGRLPRRASHFGQRGRPLLPRPGMGGEGAENLPRERRRRPVRRQVSRARRARDPRSAPCGLVPRGHRRKLLGRPQHQGEDHPRGHLPREAGEEPRAVPACGGAGHVARRGHRPRRGAWTRCAPS